MKCLQLMPKRWTQVLRYESTHPFFHWFLYQNRLGTKETSFRMAANRNPGLNCAVRPGCRHSDDATGERRAVGFAQFTFAKQRQNNQNHWQQSAAAFRTNCGCEHWPAGWNVQWATFRETNESRQLLWKAVANQEHIVVTYSCQSDCSRKCCKEQKTSNTCIFRFQAFHARFQKTCLITLWWTNIAMENHHFIGKIHYKWPCSIAMLVHQRVLGTGLSKPSAVSQGSWPRAEWSEKTGPWSGPINTIWLWLTVMENHRKTIGKWWFNGI